MSSQNGLLELLVPKFCSSRLPYLLYFWIVKSKLFSHRDGWRDIYSNFQGMWKPNFEGQWQIQTSELNSSVQAIAKWPHENTK